MTAPSWPFPRRALPLAVLPVLLAACAPTEFRDDMPGRAQAFPPVRMETLPPSAALDTPAGARPRLWSEQVQEAPPRRRAPEATPQRPQEPPRQTVTPRPGDGEPPPKRRRGSSSPPPDPAALPQPPRPVPLPPVPSTQSATDAFKRDLIRPEVDRMRTDDALGRLDPLGQRDLMRRENDLRQWGDPLAR